MRQDSTVGGCKQVEVCLITTGDTASYTYLVPVISELFNIFWINIDGKTIGRHANTRDVDDSEWEIR